MNTLRPLRAVEHDAEIQLARDGQRLFDQQPLHLLALGAGLVRDQRHAQHLLGQFNGLFRRLGDLHAAALAAASGVNLRLHHDSGCAFVEQVAGRRIGFLGALDHLSARHGHSILRQDCLALVLVNFHVGMTDAGDVPAALAAKGLIVCSL